MKLTFFAKLVSYDEALGGDIIQIVFDENPEDDPLNPRSKNLCASINYEFHPCNLEFEWMDGAKFNGGLKAKQYALSGSQFFVMLEDGMSIEITHSADVKVLHKISELLVREVGGPEIA